MKAYRIRIYGRVQRAGYRRFVQELGQELGLVGYVRNEKDGSVSVFVQGEEQQITTFIKSLNNPPPPAIVKNIEQTDAKPKPKLKHFEIRYNRLVDEFQEGFGAMQSIFMNYWAEFRDYRNEFREFKEEFRDYRQEFRDFRNEFRDYRDEFRQFRKDFDEFVRRMDVFAERVTRVLEVLTEESKKSMMLLETVARDSKETRELLAESMRLLKEVAGRAV